jgi:hypothetical protein
MIAAESIDRYLRGDDLKANREKQYKNADIPELTNYKPQPALEWALMVEKLSFELFEKGFTLEEAAEEARRCLCCGPCKSCKACVVLGLQPEIPPTSSASGVEYVVLLVLLVPLPLNTPLLSRLWLRLRRY